MCIVNNYSGLDDTSTQYWYRADTSGIGLVSVSLILQPIPDRHPARRDANAVC